MTNVFASNRARLALVALAVAALGVQQVAGAASSPPAPVAQAVPPQYVAPTGPLLRSPILLNVADKLAASAGDLAPTRVTSVQSTAAVAMTTLDPQGHVPPHPSQGLRDVFASKVFVVAMHGHFTLSRVAIPRGAKAPTGTTMDLVVDAHTGHVDGVHVSNHAPAGLGALGRVESLR